MKIGAAGGGVVFASGVTTVGGRTTTGGAVGLGVNGAGINVGRGGVTGRFGLGVGVGVGVGVGFVVISVHVPGTPNNAGVFVYPDGTEYWIPSIFV